MKKLKGAAGYAVEWLQTDQRGQGEPYIKPSSLAKERAPRVGAATGGAPRPPPHPRVNLRYPPISSNPRRR